MFIKKIYFLIIVLFSSVSLASQEVAPITIEEAYVTYATSDYFRIVEVLLNSVKAFSTRPIVVIGVNADVPFSKEKYPFMIAKRIDEEVNSWNQGRFLKPKVLLAAGVRNAVYLDADIILNKGCDALFNNCQKLGSIPFAQIHFENLGPNPSIMKAMDIKKKSMPYVHDPVIVYSETCIPFIQEWDNACIEYGHLAEHEEFILNHLLWKHQLENCYIKISAPYYGWSSDYLSGYTLFNGVRHIDFYSFHGCKNPGEAQEILDRLIERDSQPEMTKSEIESRRLGEKPFVTADIRYELGNQMFQVAAAVAIALDNDYDATFPDLDRCDCWEIQENRHHIFGRLNTKIPKNEIEYIYNDSKGICPIPVKPNMKLEGLFQSERYFYRHKEAIKDLFAPSEHILSYLNNKYSHILNHPCTVGVHVRTFIKDYGHLPTIDELHAFAGIEYYEAAVQEFPADALFVVCSDNIEWCKANLAHIAPNIVFIEGNKHYHDFYLLSLCQHNITANSTFSWWAAYLNRNPHKVIVTPDNWFGRWWAHNTENIVLKDWIRISRDPQKKQVKAESSEHSSVAVYKEIKDIKHPTYQDYKHIQEYLTHGKREGLEKLADTEMKIRNMKIIGSKDDEYPERKLIAVNSSLDEKENCVVLYSSFNLNFKQGQERLIEHIKNSDYKGHILSYHGGWPDLEGGSLVLAHVPFAFKSCIIKEAQALGYKRILWLDSSILPLTSLSNIFNWIKDKGYFAVANYHSIEDYCSPQAAGYFGFNLKNTGNLVSCQAGFLGVDVTRDEGRTILDEFYKAAFDEYAYYSPRSDQSALSLILHKHHFLDLLECNKVATYSRSNITPESLFLVEWGFVHR